MIVTTGMSVSRVETGPEPVDLVALKSHLQIDFPDHDDLLAMFLVAAREEVEKYCGITLVDSEYKVRWESLSSDVIPYGPVIAITSDISDYTKTGLDYPSIKADSSEPVEIEYTAGFVTVPAGLKLAIIKLASDNFTLRTGIAVAGQNSVQSLPNDWKSLARKYGRRSWLE